MTDPAPGDKEGAGRSGRRVDPKLLELLVAPGSHNRLRYDPEAEELIDDTEGLAYPIRDGIPIMLRDEARRIVKR